MKKLLSLMLITITAISLVACGDTKPQNNDKVEQTQEKEPETTETQSDASENKEYVKLDVKYEIDEDGNAVVVGYSGEGNQITIDSDYDGHDVVRIADNAFENCTMHSKAVLI